MSPASIDEVLALLHEDRDEEIIGLEESAWFDAKGGAYALNANQARRWELAKDVSAMANASSGLILVGTKTTREQTWLEERVSNIEPIPENMLDVQQHLDAIRAWTFPPIAHRVHCTFPT